MEGHMEIQHLNDSPGHSSEQNRTAQYSTVPCFLHLDEC